MAGRLGRAPATVPASESGNVSPRPFSCHDRRRSLRSAVAALSAGLVAPAGERGSGAPAAALAARAVRARGGPFSPTRGSAGPSPCRRRGSRARTPRRMASMRHCRALRRAECTIGSGRPSTYTPAVRVVRVAVLLALALSSAACLVVGLQPVYEPDTIAFDPSLLGTWASDEDGVSVTIERGEWHSYHLCSATGRRPRACRPD